MLLYIARGSALEKVIHSVGYKPHKIQSVLQTVIAANKMNVPIYTGSWSENLSDEKGDFSSRKGYDKEFRKALRQFNKTQDPSVIKRYENLMRT